MYRGFGPAWEGFGKSLFAAFGYRVWAFVPVWLWLGVVFGEPPLIAVLVLAGVLPAALLPPAAAAVALSTGLWALALARFRLPLGLVLLYPLLVLLAASLALRSLALALTGRATWKGCAVAQGR